MPGATSQPGVDDSLKGLVLMGVGPHVVLQDRAARENERKDHDPNANRGDCLLGQLAAEEEHDRRAESRQQRDQVDIIQEEQVQLPTPGF